MADDRDDLPQDAVAAALKAIQRAMVEGPVRLPSVPPSEVPTGLDARMVREAVQDIVARQTALFLTSEQIEARIDKKVAERLGSIGLRVDEDHIEETGSSVRNVLKWQRRIEVAGNTIVGGLILTAFYTLMKLIGIKLPNPPGLG